MNFENFLEKINGMIWGNGLIFLLIGCGLFYTIRLGFIQLRLIPELLKTSAKTKSEGDGISQIKTIFLSLGTAMGTGNITGVASALLIGGAGAIFWMWVSAFFGMAIVYAENYLAAVYKKEKCAGPMAYLKYGLNLKILPAAFAIFCICASLGMGGMVQVNSFSGSLFECTDIDPRFVFSVSFILIYIIIKGGARRISSASQLLLPIAAISVGAVCIISIVKNHERVPIAVKQIFTQAFNFRSAAGGVTGFTVSSAVSAGMRRGIFSNEAGLGSSPILHSASSNSCPKLQGLCAMAEVFIDTIVCCTITALTLLSAPIGDYSIISALENVTGNHTDIFITASLSIFALCTIIGWYYCGETAFIFIFGSERKKYFTLIFSFIASLGAILTLNTVWTLSDVFNGLMAFPNLLALFLLFRKVRKE